MEYKPWPLIILAIIHIIEPITKLFFYSFIYSISPLAIVDSLFQSETTLQLINFFVLFPIAGIAILAVKKWSLPVFLSIEIFVFINNIGYLHTLLDTHQYIMFSSFIIFGFLNITIVVYLLIPAVRIAYLDPRVRWWETHPRYQTDIDCTISNNLVGKIQNISLSGVFITSINHLELDSLVTVEFNAPSKNGTITLKPSLKVLNKYTVNNSYGYGAVFSNLTINELKQLKVLIKYLDKSKAIRRPAKRTIKSFFCWIFVLITTGKGLLQK